MKRLIVALLVVYVFLFLVSVTMSQYSNSEAQGETDEITALEQEKQIAELKQAEALALQAIEKSKLPQTTTKGLTGTVTVTPGAGYYAEILAYKAMECSAEEITKKLKSKLSGGSLIILGQTDLSTQTAIWNLLDIKLDSVTTALESSLKEYKKLLVKKPTVKITGFEFLTIAPVVLGAVADIVSFFIIDRKIISREVEINEQALFAAIANKFKMEDQTHKSSCLDVILPVMVYFLKSSKR